MYFPIFFGVIVLILNIKRLLSILTENASKTQNQPIYSSIKMNHYLKNDSSDHFAGENLVLVEPILALK